MSDRSAAGDGPATEAAGVQVILKDLRISVPGRTLLEGVSAEFSNGVTLIVGPSGAGKSALLRVLAGLDDGGEVLRSNRSSAIKFQGSGSRARPRVGVVFQHFALLDELSPKENVRLARAASRSKLSVSRLLKELNIPGSGRTSSLSGGQRQRLAIARTLAADPDVILYDEPTSGLDASAAGQVADLIRRTQDAHAKTSIIVTHDYDALPRIADKVYLLDPERRALVEIPRAQWPQLRELLQKTSASPLGAEEQGESLGKALVARASKFFAQSSRCVEQLCLLPTRLFPLWRTPLWGVRFCLHYLRLVADPSAWLYIALSGMIIGFVSTFFTFKYLPYRSVTEPLLIEELLGALGFALYRVLIPVLVTILIAARCGAAVASDLGSKAYGRQLDALKTLQIEPKRYLLTGVLYAFLLGTPLLLAIGYVAGNVTSLVVFTVTHDHLGPFFWDRWFHDDLRVTARLLYRGTGWLVAKVLVCAFGIAAISYYCGAAPKHSGTHVSRGITSSILWSTLFVLAVHFTFSFFEFENQ